MQYMTSEREIRTSRRDSRTGGVSVIDPSYDSTLMCCVLFLQVKL